MLLVSVTIPACNGTTRFLDQALAGVEAQTIRDVELILQMMRPLTASSPISIPSKGQVGEKM